MIERISDYIKENSQGLKIYQNPKKGIRNVKGNVHEIKKAYTLSKMFSDHTKWGRVRVG